MSTVSVIHKPEETIVTPAYYEVTLKLNQEQLDWLCSFCGEIAGNCNSPLREVTDLLYKQLKNNRSDLVENITKEHWVTYRGEMYND